MVVLSAGALSSSFTPLSLPNHHSSLLPITRTQLCRAFPPPHRITMEAQAQAQAQPKEAKLWGGRFEEGVTDAVERFTESVSFDKQLYKHDIMGSRAHASMLAHQVG